MSSRLCTTVPLDKQKNRGDVALQVFFLSKSDFHPNFCVLTFFSMQFSETLGKNVNKY